MFERMPVFVQRRAGLVPTKNSVLSGSIDFPCCDHAQASINRRKGMVRRWEIGKLGNRLKERNAQNPWCGGLLDGYGA